MPGPMGGGGSVGGGGSGGGRSSGGSGGGGAARGGRFRHSGGHYGSTPKYRKFRHATIEESIFGISVAVLIFIVFLILVIPALFDVTIGPLLNEDSPLNEVKYKESTFYEFANSQYYELYSETENYEGNILLVFAVYNDRDGYSRYDFVAWGGYDIDTKIDNLFGAFFRNVVKEEIPTHYENAMTKSFKNIINQMTLKVSVVAEPSNEAVEAEFSRLHNKSSLSIQETVVNDELIRFAQETGINISIVVEDGIDIFGAQNKNSTLGVILRVVVVLLILTIIITGCRHKMIPKPPKNDYALGLGRYDHDTKKWVNE